MTTLFEPVLVGRLALRNRLMRSATAERMATRRPARPCLHCASCIDSLLMAAWVSSSPVTSYIARGGKGHPEMAALDRDDLIPVWRDVDRVQRRLPAPKSWSR